nr:TatD family hydrolase [Neobacillus sp. Marseille-Q6967]
MKIIDSHIHLDKYKDEEISHILENSTGIDKLISVSFDLNSCQKNLELARKYSKVKTAFGFHPEQELPTENGKLELFNWIEIHKDEMIAIGEVGLPYYLKQSQKVSPKQYEQYIELLEAFIQKAEEWQKPVILHAVYDDSPIVCGLLEKYSTKKAHFHWFKGDSKTINRMIENGYFISITPEIVYKEKIQQLVKTYPLSKMMVETDGPWPFEGPFSGRMTHPNMIQESIRMVAKIKKLPINEVEERLFQNTLSFYQLSLY